MIRGLHAMFYSSEAEALRAFLRDKLGLRATDVGDGWLIFDPPQADLGVHPTEGSEAASGTAELSFYCDHIEQTVAELEQRGVEFTQAIEDHGYGLVTYFRVPGDDLGRPGAAVIATDWGDGITLDPILIPGVTPDGAAHVIKRGLAHASESGFADVDVVIDRADDLMREVLAGHGFAIEGDGTGASPASLSVVTAWLAADARPEIGPLHEGYRLSSRHDAMQRPHHLIQRSGPEVETRLRQTTLYRPDLDLFVLDPHDRVAAYALFWFDPETAVGLVEPMRTEAEHQRRGLAHYLLSAGIELLARAGAERIRLCFGADNPAARDLYLGIGFEADKRTLVFSRRNSAQAS